MARSPWLAPLALLMIVVMFFTGCMSQAPRGLDDGSTVAAVSVSGPHHAGDAAKAGALKAHCGGGGGGAVAVLVFYGIVILGALILDCIILPATAPCHHAFCCTEGVLVVYR